MTDVPQQDWSLYEAWASASDTAWVRGLTLADRFALYEDLFGLVCGARIGRGNWERLERWRWRQKVATRLRLVEAFTKLDQINRE